MKFVHNPDYADGLSTSLRAGVASLPSGIDAAVVILADMPGVSRRDDRPADRRLRPDRGRAHRGADLRRQARQPGALVAARFFPDLLHVEGDTGGRHLIGANPDAVAEVEIGPAVALDIDTQAELTAAGGSVAPE